MKQIIFDSVASTIIIRVAPKFAGCLKVIVKKGQVPSPEITYFKTIVRW